MNLKYIFVDGLPKNSLSLFGRWQEGEGKICDKEWERWGGGGPEIGDFSMNTIFKWLLRRSFVDAVSPFCSYTFETENILNFQRPTVSWKLFSGRLINAVMTTHASSITEYGPIAISNNFTLDSLPSYSTQRQI